MERNFTAVGSGYFRVFVDGVQVSQHTAEREATERAGNEKENNPNAEVYYDHDYHVEVSLVGIGENVGQNVGENTGTSGEPYIALPPAPTGDWKLDAAYWEPSNYPLEVIQPRPNLNTNNRFYKAYPSLNYNVRVAIRGGAYPYHHVLTAAPAGMTINAYTGEINWPNPTTSGSVTVAIYDQENTITPAATVTWTITVTTEGFYFLDAVAGTTVGGGGTGTIDNPWKGINDWYLSSETDSTYVNAFLYYKTGTYPIDDAPIDVNSGFVCSGNNKPIVWLAYPGNSPVIDMAAGLITTYGASDFYMGDGIAFDNNANARGIGWNIGSAGTRVCFYKTKHYGLTNGTTGGNTALIYLVKNNAAHQPYYVFQDNELYDASGTAGEAIGILAYTTFNCVVEDNIFHNIAGLPCGPKEGNQFWAIRRNYFYSNSIDSIWHYNGSNGGIDFGDMEICYNLVVSGGGRCRINARNDANGLKSYIFRNTFVDQVNNGQVTATNGPYIYSKNVIVNEYTAYTDHIRVDTVLEPSNIVYDNNLYGELTDNIVSASTGLLTGSSRTSFLYQRGHELPTPYESAG